jgi:hypothetical protein
MPYPEIRKLFFTARVVAVDGMPSQRSGFTVRSVENNDLIAMYDVLFHARQHEQPRNGRRRTDPIE